MIRTGSDELLLKLIRIEWYEGNEFKVDFYSILLCKKEFVNEYNS